MIYRWVYYGRHVLDELLYDTQFVNNITKNLLKTWLILGWIGIIENGGSLGNDTYILIKNKLEKEYLKNDPRYRKS